MLWVLEPETVSNGVELDAALRMGLMRMKNSDHPIMIATSQMLLLAKGYILRPIWRCHEQPALSRRIQNRHR